MPVPGGPIRAAGRGDRGGTPARSPGQGRAGLVGERGQEGAGLGGVLHRPLRAIRGPGLAEDALELPARLRDPALLREGPGQPDPHPRESGVPGEPSPEHGLCSVEVAPEDGRHLEINVAGQGVDGGEARVEVEHRPDLLPDGGKEEECAEDALRLAPPGRVRREPEVGGGVPGGPADGTAGRLAAVVVGLELLGGGPRPHVAPDEAHLGEGEEVGEVWLGRQGVLESSADRVETRRVLVVAREPDLELGDPRGGGLDRARPATDRTGQDQEGEDQARDGRELQPSTAA